METKQEGRGFSQAIDLIRKHLILIAFIIYASGFFIWNLYLSSFGFFEYNFIQIRFLSAGLLLWLPVITIFVFGDFFLKRTPQKYPRLRKLINLAGSVLTGIWLGVWFGLFLTFFASVPQYLGGGRPVPVSILGTPEQIAFLANFDIGLAENAKGKRSVQTSPVCLIYENDHYILFFNSRIATSSYQNGFLNFAFLSRTISLSKDQFLGLQSKTSDFYPYVCGLSSSMYGGLVQVPVGTTK